MSEQELIQNKISDPNGLFEPMGDISWTIAFSRNCNMRCSYCYTCYGTLGKKPAVMQPSVWKLLGKRIIESVQSGQNADVYFGSGETFVYFDEFAQFVEYLEALASERKVGLSVKVSTNGFALDRERLSWCANHRISLNFSIDGPAEIHDRCRRDRNGNPTHARIIENWKIYREYKKSLQARIPCSVRSVIHEHSRLKDVAGYWAENEVPIFDAAVQEPLPAYIKSSRMRRSRDGWETRRNNYLSDYETLAMDAAKNLSIPFFLSDYAGPSSLLGHWRNLFLEKRPEGGCGAAICNLAVDIEGNLYPCDGFIAYPAWVIGNLHSGLVKNRVLGLRHERNALMAECNTCEASILCNRGCCASSPERGLVLNTEGGCDFMKKIVGISRKSYEVLKAT